MMIEVGGFWELLGTCHPELEEVNGAFSREAPLGDSESLYVGTLFLRKTLNKREEYS